MTITPLLDRILVEVKRATAKDGIVLTEKYQDTPLDGIATSVGPEVKLVREGMRVLLPRHGGQNMKTPDGKEFVLIREMDCIGVET